MRGSNSNRGCGGDAFYAGEDLTPCERGERRGEELAVGEHREQLSATLREALDHVLAPRGFEAGRGRQPRPAPVAGLFDAALRVHALRRAEAEKRPGRP